jgi:predicted enzyme related to lactoylglutathione lyase
MSAFPSPVPPPAAQSSAGRAAAGTFRPPPGLSDRWFRSCPDSSALPCPRLLARSLIDAADLDSQIDFYERLLGIPADLRMPIPDFGGLELAAIGSLLLIASERPFTPVQRQTAYSLIVPSLRDALAAVAGLGGVVLEPPEDIVPGSRARVRYPDGCLAELVEHRPRPGEQPWRPATAGPATARPPGRGAARLLARRAVAPGELAAAIAFYASALEAVAELLRPGGPDGPQLARIGDLLLVAADGTGPAGPTTSEPTTSEAATPEAATPEAATPEAATQEPATQEPASQEPASPEPQVALVVAEPTVPALPAAPARGATAWTGPRLVTLASGLRAEVWDDGDIPE